MKKSTWKMALFLPVVGVLLLALTVIVGAAGQQHWKLDSETTAADHEMERVEGSGDDGQTGTVTIVKEGCKIWIADEYAEVDVTFAGGSWLASLCTSEDWSNYLEVSIGEWDGSFTAFSTVTKVNFGWSSGIIRVESQLNSETISEDNYLALQICNLSTDTDYTVTTNGCSELTSPCEDPGYPVPEIAGGILFGLGLIGLLGYVGIRRMRNKNVKV